MNSEIAQAQSDTIDPWEIGRLLGVPRSTVYALAARGEIPTFRVGAKLCARRKSIIAWIENQERGKQPMSPTSDPSPRRGRRR